MNNLYVSSCNLGFDPIVYLQSIPTERVMEFHLAGHTEKVFPDGSVLNDDHATPVSDAVWRLYRQTVLVIRTGFEVELRHLAPTESSLLCGSQSR